MEIKKTMVTATNTAFGVYETASTYPVIHADCRNFHLIIRCRAHAPPGNSSRASSLSALARKKQAGNIVNEFHGRRATL